jgi:hypothetical protein
MGAKSTLSSVRYSNANTLVQVLVHWGAPIAPDSSVSQLLQKIGCRVTSGCEGGEFEEKPHQGVQAPVLPAGSQRREAPAQIRREHNLSESVLLKWRKEYEARGEAAFTEKQPSANETLQARIAENSRHDMP